MTVRIACTHCGSGLSMPETMYGQPVRCPKCQQVFQCPPAPVDVASSPSAAPPTAPPPARVPRKRPATMPSTGGNAFDFGGEEPSPAPRRDREDPEGDLPSEDDVRLTRRGQHKQGWERACQGGIHLCISAGLYLAFYLVLHFLIEGPRHSADAKDMLRYLLIGESLLLLAASALGTLGLSRFAAVPSASGARGAAGLGAIALMLSTLTSFIASVIMILAMFGTDSGPGMGKAMVWLSLGAITTLVAAFVLCIFFLTIAAVHLQNQAMLGSVVAYGVVLMVSPFLLIGIALFTTMMGLGGDPFAREPSGRTLTGTVNLMMILGLTAWFIANVLTLNAAVARARRKGLI